MGLNSNLEQECVHAAANLRETVTRVKAENLLLREKYTVWGDQDPCYTDNVDFAFKVLGGVMKSSPPGETGISALKQFILISSAEK